MFHKNDRVGIVCCSNGLDRKEAGKVSKLAEILRSIGLEPVLGKYLYAVEDVFGGTGMQRAQVLMDFYRDDSIRGIFDISGGDLANGILPYLDYDVIAKSGKTFWGYSDLTTVVNALYARTGRASVLYQIRNLVCEHGERQRVDFANTVMHGKEDLFRIRYEQLSAKDGACRKMQGIVVGGNIRCFLKLAGTEYMPDLQDKILLLESYSGTAARMETYLCQLEQIGAFRKVSGILLGTFTQMQAVKSVITMETLVRKFAGEDLPIAVTGQIGHGADSKGIWIGKEWRK